MKRFLALLLTSVTLCTTCAFGADTTRFVCNGKEAAVSAAAIFKDGYTYLPVAQVCKALGYHVIEKSSNNSVTAEVRGKSGYFSVFLGKQTGRMNGQNIHLAKAPFSENGIVYVSSKLVEEQLGVKVNYDSSKNTIYINSAGEGKITSTVGKAPVAKTNTSVKSTTLSSNYKKYQNATYTPDFTAVTGITCTIQDKNQYHYDNATQSDMNKYINCLESNGFKYVTESSGSIVVKRRVIYKKGNEYVAVSNGSINNMKGSSYLTGQSTSTASISSTEFVEVHFGNDAGKVMYEGTIVKP